MATKYTKEWTEFFTKSGIPAEAAANYALIFYENRIQKNMLLDLNKEYLRDMGVTVMGDIIAILRYAKIAYKNYMSEQIMVEKNEFAIENKNKSAFPTKNLPMTNVKMKIQWNDLESKEEKVDKQIQKIRRVHQEEKLGYKIKMPAEVTERLVTSEQSDKKELKTVFDRLGESSVSSTTSEMASVNSIFNDSNSAVSSNNKSKTISVFSRLGEKTVSAVSSTSSFDPKDHLISDNVSDSGTKSVPLNKKNFLVATMRADNEQQKKFKKSSDNVKTISVKKRLGITKTPTYGEDKGKLNSLQRKNFFDKTYTEKSICNQKSDIISHKSVKSRLNIEKVSLTTEKKAPMLNGSKRKLNSESMRDTSSSKKVRFGSTTLRLIPSTSLNAVDGSTNSKNFSKLSLNFNTKKILGENRNLSSGFRPLSKPFQGRMFKTPGGIVSDATVTAKRNRSICDRLG